MPNRALCLQTTQVSIDHYDTPVISNFSQSRRLTPLAWVRLFHFIIAFLQSLLVIMKKALIIVRSLSNRRDPPLATKDKEVYPKVYEFA